MNTDQHMQTILDSPRHRHHELRQFEVDEDNDIDYAHDDDIIFCCNEENLKSNCV